MTEKITFKKLAKMVKNSLNAFLTTSKNMRQNPYPFLERFSPIYFLNGIKNSKNIKTSFNAFLYHFKKSETKYKIIFKLFLEIFFPLFLKWY